MVRVPAVNTALVSSRLPIATQPKETDAAIKHDPDERHVEALTEIIRRGIESGTSDEDIEQIARAALGDDEADDEAEASRIVPRRRMIVRAASSAPRNPARTAGPTSGRTGGG